MYKVIEKKIVHMINHGDQDRLAKKEKIGFAYNSKNNGKIGTFSSKSRFEGSKGMRKLVE